MKTEQAEKLLELFEAGYAIHISSYYVSGMVSDIHEDEADGMVYSDDVYSDRPLSTVNENDVEVYEQIKDWKHFHITK